MLADRQTDTQTDELITIPIPRTSTEAE